MSVSDRIARVRATGRLWNTVLLVLDACAVVVATAAAYWVRFEGTVPAAFESWTLPLILVSMPMFLLLFAVFGQYRLILRFVGLDSLLKLSAATVIGFSALVALDLVLGALRGFRPVPLGVLFIQALVVFLGASGARVAARVLGHLRASTGTGRRVLIVGAGSAGSLLLREITNRPDLGLSVVGFIDDEAPLKGRTIFGVPVLGTTDTLTSVVARHHVQEIVVAMPSAPRETVRRILNEAADAGVETRVMPELVIAKGSVSLRDLRPVDVEDLLGREPTPIDVHEVQETVEGRVVAVTGAAGSIGSELCRQIMRLKPARLVLIDIDETRLYELWLELKAAGPDIAVMTVCDVRDPRKLDLVFAEHRPRLVLHAAAYKHVPLMELEPREAVLTNVLGTLQVVEACERHGVERFVLISTDKAVAPANMMGLTKALAERVMLDAARRGRVNAVAVRFGNVLASRGSVVPIFEEQLRHGGPLTVTHPEVTRYFMTIPEASRLVLQAQAIGRSGDIFVLEMGEPVRIVDLARKMIALSGVPADIELVGLRPGEKLHEELVSQTEKLIPSEREKILRVDRVAWPEPDFSERVRRVARATEGFARADVLAAVSRLLPEFEPAATASGASEPPSAPTKAQA